MEQLVTLNSLRYQGEGNLTTFVGCLIKVKSWKCLVNVYECYCLSIKGTTTQTIPGQWQDTQAYRMVMLPRKYDSLVTPFEFCMVGQSKALGHCIAYQTSRVFGSQLYTKRKEIKSKQILFLVNQAWLGIVKRS